MVEGDRTADLVAGISSDDPAVGLRAVGALHRLAEQVEAAHVRLARDQGWSWEQIGDALGVSRQSVHAKYGKAPWAKGPTGPRGREGRGGSHA
jgi:hypothetical protein